MKDEGRRMKSSVALRALLSFCILHSAFCILNAQETEPPRKPGVKLMFVPPPMEGTISLGIYDAKGKLVRTLHREAEVESDEFGKALNGLVTYWNGKNDAGAQMPAGKYFARGFMVGDIRCEGEALLCNDWIADDETQRMRRISLGNIQFIGFAHLMTEDVQFPERLELLGISPDGKLGATFIISADGKVEGSDGVKRGVMSNLVRDIDDWRHSLDLQLNSVKIHVDEPERFHAFSVGKKLNVWTIVER